MEVEGQVVNEVGPGDVIGEIALVENTPRSATIRAKSAVDTATVSRDTFHTLVAHFPGVKEAMEALMSEYHSDDAS